MFRRFLSMWLGITIVVAAESQACAWCLLTCRSDLSRTEVIKTLKSAGNSQAWLITRNLDVLERVEYREHFESEDDHLTSTALTGLQNFIAGQDIRALVSARVYLGLNLSRLKPESIRVSDDMITVSLPPVEILDIAFDPDKTTILGGRSALIGGTDRDELLRMLLSQARPIVVADAEHNEEELGAAAAEGKRIIGGVLARAFPGRKLIFDDVPMN